MDPYAVLGLERDASEEEIRRAYRRSVLLWHPDRNPDPDAAATFHAVQRAYELLRDPARRQANGFGADEDAGVRTLRFDDGPRPDWVPPENQRETLRFVVGEGWTSLDDAPPDRPAAGPGEKRDADLPRRRWTRDERLSLAVAVLAAVGGCIAIALAPMFS